MCGIAGLLDLSGAPVSLSTILKMTNSIKHRGPDGEGSWIKRNFGLGHRRLAIIDVSSAGEQPMHSANNRFVISYNGEIYNYRELRKYLETKGVKFKSTSDTEVVLESFAYWGIDCVKKFNGMFAFAIWDKTQQRLYLARDRYGIKPLYYSIHNNVFSFASEQRAITTLPDISRELNLSAVYEYFTFQNIFTDQTFNSKIKILPAGSYMEIQYPKGEIKKFNYWDFNFQNPDSQVDDREYEEEFRRLFKQAVTRQLNSDVEIGAYLSGGLDSSAITSIASSTFPNLKTFTCGFDLDSISGLELAFDERGKAANVSNFCKTDHFETVIKSGDMEKSLDAVAKTIEEPRVGQSYPNYFAAKLASRSVKVVLSGAGADEIFAGYPWRYFVPAKNLSYGDYIDSYYLHWHRLLNNTDLRELFTPVWGSVKNVWTKDIFTNVLKEQNKKPQSKADYVNLSLYFEAKTFLHGLLVVEDKLSMHHSLESRIPFLDNDLVDFAMKLPVNLKINNFNSFAKINENNIFGKQVIKNNSNLGGKQILRSSLRDFLPLDAFTAPKQGFSAPDASWFRGKSNEYVKSELFNKNQPIYQILNFSKSKSLISQHLDGLENRRLFIWSLLNFNSLLKEVYE
jgi:asparagine synthase (glutamine-hydrolysing)